jgi:hypothetical protein
MFDKLFKVKYRLSKVYDENGEHLDFVPVCYWYCEDTGEVVENIIGVVKVIITDIIKFRTPSIHWKYLEKGC